MRVLRARSGVDFHVEIAVYRRSPYKKKSTKDGWRKDEEDLPKALPRPSALRSVKPAFGLILMPFCVHHSRNEVVFC